MTDPRLEEATALMQDFAQRTGLDVGHRTRRYLWTDAFAVCNFLGLARATGASRFTDLALRLVDEVHHTLGRHRDDDSRRGWISGLDEAVGEAHPTRGGLRIGKPNPERAPGEPFDEYREWERDGQYFHYLTKWMHALDQASGATGEARFNLWARELADTAQAAFIYVPSPASAPRMYWKMSIDLTRPLVSSMGQHDPLDGYVTCMQLRAGITRGGQPVAGPDLIEATLRFAAMAADGELASPDPLGIGGLLIDAWRLRQLMHQGIPANANLPERLLAAAAAGLQYYARSGELRAPAARRLAFREFGLAIGLHALARIHQTRETRSEHTTEADRLVDLLMEYRSLAEQIELFWREPVQRTVATWTEHRDINEVMLATSLAPDGFLELTSCA